MINLEQYLQEKFILQFPSIKISLSPSTYHEHDYQTNIFNVISNNKLDELKNFLENNTDINNVFDWTFSIGKQSFLNFKIKQSYLTNWLRQFYENNKSLTIDSFVIKNDSPKKILYDYSSPNLSKDMHVGHLRSTIIGDTLANVSEYLGHTVTRVNHLGDFGLPFGMIVEYVLQNDIQITEKTSLQHLYILSKSQFESDETFKNNSYLKTAELQLGLNEKVVNVWQQIYTHSLASYQKIYDLLNISKDLKITGESHYVKYINEVKELLQKSNMTEMDEHGRIIVKIENMNPMIYEKSEEKGNAYTYDTTDIVTLWYRTQMLNQDEIYYVVDSGQSLHFKQLIQLGKQMNWTNGKKVEHINFGVITGASGHRIASRAGNTPKLLDLISDGIETTKLENMEKQNNDVDELTNQAVAIGSIKYFDLSKTRTINYAFNFDQMLRYDADSYTYIAYCTSRCRGIKDKFKQSGCELPIDLDYTKLESPDFNILRKMLNFPVILQKVMDSKFPHILCSYANDLCNLLHYGYTNTRCLNFDKNQTVCDFNETRIILYETASFLLEHICKLLGLPVVKKL